jgi:hypothetical protein
MPKWTPGPWIGQNTNSEQGLIYAERDGRNVAVSYDKKDTSLIAAAPDLYEACEMALNTLEAEGDLQGAKDFYPKTIKSLKNAIAKAEGQ